MKHPMRIWILGSCALLVSSVVSAYVLLKPNRTWETPPEYTVDSRGMDSITDSTKGVAATVAAINSETAWNGAGSGTVVTAVQGPVSEESTQLGDGNPTLNFNDPFNVCDGNCLAATFTGFYEQFGRGRNAKAYIRDADIVTNTAYDWTSESEPDGCSDEFYIEGVQVHEIGHGLGLGHSNTPGATMYPSVSSCNNGPANIEQDDKNGLIALYGTSDGGGDGGGSCPLPDGTGQPGDACDSNADCCSGKCRGKRGSQTCR